jgi:hypothetical protein
LGDSGNTRDVISIYAARPARWFAWVGGSVGAGADVWCVGGWAADEKGALGSMKEAAVGVPS